MISLTNTLTMEGGQLTRYTNYQKNAALIKEIHELIAPSYKEAGSHITRDIELCPILYTINSTKGQMLALFMVGYHTVNNIECCYLGLSACREEYKSQGLVKKLYLEFNRDCIKRERELNKRIVCYGTTATPIVYYAFHKIWINPQPDMDGNCSLEGVQIISTIAKVQYPDAGIDEAGPFILRHAAHHINYSEAEKERLKKAALDLNLTVFDKFRLDETQGDRFLMIGYAYSQDKLIELINSEELINSPPFRSPEPDVIS